MRSVVSVGTVPVLSKSHESLQIHSFALKKESAQFLFSADGKTSQIPAATSMGFLLTLEFSISEKISANSATDF